MPICMTIAGHSLKEFRSNFKASFINIFSKPWDSLKKIPESYREDFDLAAEAYHKSDSRVAGAVKYSGIAVWANIKGAYYLVIEAPVKMVANATAVALLPAAALASPRRHMQYILLVSRSH